jgi:leucyl-tRNA synthetase
MRETNTMPGYAGSSWYFLRYMDPHNDEAFADRKATDYWNQVDVYVGGTEHAVGHLLYSRMWTKLLFDLDYIGFDEPYKKLLNQGMIGGISEKIVRAGKDNIEESDSSRSSSSSSFLISWALKNGLPFMLHPDDSSSDNDINYYLWNLSSEIAEYSEDTSLIKAPTNFVDNGVLRIEEYVIDKRNKLNYYKEANEIFLCKTGYYNTKAQQWYDYDKNPIPRLQFKTFQVPEKMSKRHGNVINPDDVINKYGADTFRMYEMFLGPVEQSKPWDTKGIEGVHRFLKKLWRLFYDEQKGKVWNEEKPTTQELKILHKTIKKIEEDTDRFSYNTAVSAFMVCVNELADIKCHKKQILQPLLILISPYAPHIAEELYQLLNSSSSQGERLGEGDSILNATFPVFDPNYLIESSKEYPVSVNGKMRTTINIKLDAAQEEVEKIVLSNEIIQKWIDGKSPKKIIFVKNKMVNIVV